jgi:hypothetical protein
MMWVEKGFDSNDYFVLAAVMVSWGVYFYMPKIFSKQITVLIFLYTLTAAGIFDNSFGAPPFDFYDIMDGAAYTGMDIVVYFIYPPFAYVFLFFYKALHIRNRYLVLYIFSCSFSAISVEWIFHKFGVFHYKNGYNIFYSVCIYLMIQSILLLFFRLIKENH